jgi:hypothetical protein
VRKASGALRHRVGDVHEVADHLVDVTDRHPDAVMALDGLGRFLAIVKNIDHFLVASSIPPAGSIPTKRARGAVYWRAQNVNEQFSQRNAPAGPGTLWPPQRGPGWQGASV